MQRLCKGFWARVWNLLNMFKETTNNNSVNAWPFGISEECGVFGIYDKTGKTDLVYETYRALFSLQHRGQESCGIATNVDGVLDRYVGMGLVQDVFSETTLSKLDSSAKMCTGHVRYATSGGKKSINNAQPMIVHHNKGAMALCHNGNLTNAATLRKELELRGSIFHGTSDTEIITHLITRFRLEQPNIESAIAETMKVIEGAYSLVVMSATKLIAARDARGFRPLCIGELPRHSGFVVASESCALDTVGAKLIRDVAPGEIVVIDKSGLRSINVLQNTVNRSLCVFEYMYFARPDSVIEGTCVHQARVNAGKFLAAHDDVQADVVIGAPDSGIDAAQGYAKESGIPYATGIVKNKYVGRSFIQGSQRERENTVRIKLNPIPSVIEGKRVVLVDDSIVRGTTSKELIELIRRCGAREVHFRVSSPPFRHACYFGTDVPDSDLLVATNRSVEEIREILGCDTLQYLSEYDALHLCGDDEGFCMGCFTGKYPIEIKDKSMPIPYTRPLSESGTCKTL